MPLRSIVRVAGRGGARVRPDARAPRRRRARHLAQGGRGRPGQLGPRARPASGRRAAPRRDDRAARGRPQRVADHGDPDGRGVGGRDEALARPRPTGRDPRLGRPGPLARGRDARGAAGGGAPRLEPGPGARRGARARGAWTRVRHRRRGARRRRRGLHVHRVTGADRRARRPRAGRPRERGRLVRHRGRASSRRTSSPPPRSSSTGASRR